MKRLILFFLLAGLAQADDALLQQTKDSALKQAGDTVSGVADVASSIQKDAKRDIRVSINLVPSYLNKDVDNAQAKALIDDSAQHLEIAVMFKANKQDPFHLAKSTHAYFSLHKLSYVNSAEDWADHTDSLAFVYGHRYYEGAHYTGVGYGWYAGVSKWSNSDAYYWNYGSSTAMNDIEDDGISFVGAGELFYTYEYEHFFTTARVILSLDTQTSEFIFAPQLMVGAKF